MKAPVHIVYQHWALWDIFRVRQLDVIETHQSKWIEIWCLIVGFINSVLEFFYFNLCYFIF